MPYGKIETSIGYTCGTKRRPRLPRTRRLVNPDSAKMAESAGILGVHVEEPEEVRPALIRAFENDVPALVDIVVNGQELANAADHHFRTGSGLQALSDPGRSEWRADEVIDLATTNLRR